MDDDDGMTDDALRATWGFTEADLATNRAGKLSPTQQTKMTKAKGQSQVMNLVFGAIFGVILIVIGVIVIPPLLAPQPANSSAVPPGIIVLVIVVVAGIMGFSLMRSRRKLNRLDGAVLMTEGEAKTKEGEASIGDDALSMSTYRLKVGSVTFPLSTAAQLGVFSDGQRYRVYYVKGTLPIIVSAETV
ncbi:MAG: hypothetical protein ABI435_03225 [Pseudolysinimonas sp.]